MMRKFVAYLKIPLYRHLLWVIIVALDAVFDWYYYSHNHYQGYITVGTIVLLMVGYVIVNVLIWIVLRVRKSYMNK